MNKVLVAISVAGVLSACASAPTTSKVPGSTISPPELLEYTVQSLERHVSEKYSCKEVQVVSVEPPKKTSGATTEVWHTKSCGIDRRFAMILVPDGTGGVMVSIGE